MANDFCITINVFSLFFLYNPFLFKSRFLVVVNVTKMQVKRDKPTNRKTANGLQRIRRRKSKNKCKITSCLACFGKELGQVYHASLECFSLLCGTNTNMSLCLPIRQCRDLDAENCNKISTLDGLN
jgi:hypothetical protein